VWELGTTACVCGAGAAQVYSLDDFVAEQAEHKAEVEGRLALFHADTFETVMQACRWAPGEAEKDREAE
jgi:hypothetical protein